MSRFARIAHTSIGKKLIMAATGAGLLAWVIGHLTGNLKVFFGRDEVNDYAQWLKDHPSLLWPTRVGILAFFLYHIFKGFTLWRDNKRARPMRYHSDVALRSSFASRHMLFSGLLVLSFVVFHLLHLTFQVTHPEFQLMIDSSKGHHRPDVFQMVLSAFQDPLVATSYVIAIGLLGLHLSHGAASLFQTLGLSHPTYGPLLRRAAKVLAVLLVLGFWSIPIAVFVHFTLGIKLPFPDWSTVHRW
jgi:succinate dehydrogenase / fumarate reductase cytochrome b subunit